MACNPRLFLLWLTMAVWSSGVFDVQSGVVLHEIMARNDGAVLNATGSTPDWIELHNPDATEARLDGLYLSFDESLTNRWAFPSGTKIGPLGYLIVWCDKNAPASIRVETQLNCGLPLDGESGLVGLVNAQGVAMDSVRYGFQISNLTVGRIGQRWGLLAKPTPALPNAVEMIASGAYSLRINEWMANPMSGDDWFELFNPEDKPVALSGLLLIDDPLKLDDEFHEIGPLSFIGPQSWTKFIADKKTNSGMHHVSFALNSDRGSLLLYDASRSVVDRIDYGAQSKGVSEGRFPDGAGDIMPFIGAVTPGEANRSPLPAIWINELLAHTDSPLEDAIEFYNPNSSNVDIGGWFLSNDADNLKLYRIPDNTIVPARGYFVLYEYQFKGVDNFTFNSAHGDLAILSSADKTGNLTGFRTHVSFGASYPAVSFGRYLSSAGVKFVPLKERSFGVDLPSTLQEFRAGRGATNSLPKVGPLVFNEIMYHPQSAASDPLTDNTMDEFLELYNITPYSVPMYHAEYWTNQWQIKGGVQFNFPPNTWLPSKSLLLVVSFDPATNAVVTSNFRLKYGIPNTISILGPYIGKLSNRDDVVQLLAPDSPQQPPHPDAGYVPYVIIDEIHYNDALPWPPEADGSGFSLQRIRSDSYGDDPMNWIAAAPTAGRMNAVEDQDSDGLPDAWEFIYGLNSQSAADALVDSDKDGLTNLQEYWAGTIPTKKDSVLRLELKKSADSRIMLRFEAIAGKTYSVMYSDSSSLNKWFRLLNVPMQETSGYVEMFDPTLPLKQTRYYRLVTPMLQ